MPCSTRLKMNGDLEQDVEHWKRRLLGRVSGKGASLERLGEGAVRNPLAPRVLFEDRKFATESGKVNLIHEIQDVGFDYGMSPREVGQAVVDGHLVLWEREVDLKDTK